MSNIELVSRGYLDVYLTGNPSITFFKTVYETKIFQWKYNCWFCY